MNDLEHRLQETLHATRDAQTQGLSGPAVRRAARTRTLRFRTGGVAVLSAAGAVAVLAAPGLVNAPGSSSVSPGAKPTAAPTASNRPVPTADAAKKRPAAAPTTAATGAPVRGVPVQANVWSPAGALIDNQTILSQAPRVSGNDTDWVTWSGGRPLLDPKTVSVVYADKATLDDSGPRYPRPLVIVTGHVSANDSTLQIAALTTIAGGVDSTTLGALGLMAIHPLTPGTPQAIAVADGMSAFVAADGGITAATYAYTDATGSHTAEMTLERGVATVLAVHGRTITNIKALSHGKVVWDAAPVKGR